MSRRFKLRDIPSDSGEDAATASYVIDRRGFLKSSFNAAAGLVTLAAGGVAFAATLMGTSEVDGGDSAVRFWVPTGAEDSVWYGTQHLEPMSYSSFVNAAAQSPTGISGAQGVWSGMPVNVVYVPHEENKNSPPAEGKPRFQFMDGYTAEGKYIGSAYEMEEDESYSALSIHDNLIVIFSRCTHLCCIPVAARPERLHQRHLAAWGDGQRGQQAVLHMPLLADSTRRLWRRTPTGTGRTGLSSNTSG